MEKVKWSEKETNRNVLELIGDKSTLLHGTNVIWIGHILRRNLLHRDACGGEMTEVKGV